MPELPEVETIKNYISPILEHKKFSEINIINANLRIDIPEDLVQKLMQKKILRIERKAKYIVIYLVDNLTLIIHLGMTGKIVVHTDIPNFTKHDHVCFKLSSGEYIIYNDQRKFGLITYSETTDISQEKFFKHLGIEPLSIEFNGKYLKKIIRNKTVPIKKFIMEQKNIVGVGNIYASEALFLSKINPKRDASLLSSKERDNLVENIKIILKNAIAKGGSTIKDYKSANGEAGYFQYEFNVYGREKKSCKSCGTTIKRIVQGGRSTFYCPKCQKN